MQMSQGVTTRFAPSDDLALLVTSQADVVTVQAGTFKLKNVSYTLATDQSYTVTVPNAAYPTTIWGYLVVIRETEVVTLLVDEVSGEPGDIPFGFTVDGPYELLATVFEIQIPTGAPDFATLGCRSFKIDPVPELRVPNLTLPAPMEVP